MPPRKSPATATKAEPPAAPAKNPRGRPTDFDPAIGEQIIKDMEAGLSLAAAAAGCRIHRQRVYEWAERHPDFADAINLGRSLRQRFLEQRLLSSDNGPQVTSTIFALKNACPDDWREKTTLEHSGPDGGPVRMVTSQMSPEEALEAYAGLLRGDGSN